MFRNSWDMEAEVSVRSTGASNTEQRIGLCHRTSLRSSYAQSTFCPGAYYEHTMPTQVLKSNIRTADVREAGVAPVGTKAHSHTFAPYLLHDCSHAGYGRCHRRTDSQGKIRTDSQGKINLKTAKSSETAKKSPLRDGKIHNFSLQAAYITSLYKQLQRTKPREKKD
jgi:hypothetical protein